jgi:hypothetical protein
MSSIPVDRTKQTSTPCGCFFVWYDTDNSTGIEGGAANGSERFALRNKENRFYKGKTND